MSTNRIPRAPRRLQFCSFSFAMLMAMPALLAQGRSKLPWSTLTGGGSSDTAYAVAVDVHGLVTIAGRTESGDRPYGKSSGVNADVFVARLDPSKAGADQLVWCTMLDGGGSDMSFDLAMSRDGSCVTVIGLTTSPGLPVTKDAYQRSLRGTADAFILQLHRNGSIAYCSYLGGDGNDWANAVELDATGRLVLVGVTDSNSFPTTAGAFDRTWNGATDIFVCVFDPAQPVAGQLVHSTFLGGGSFDGYPFNLALPINMRIGDITVDRDGSIVVAGRTATQGLPSFPTTAGAFQPAHAGGLYADMFVTRFDPALASLRYSTFLGGSDDDGAMKLALGASGDVYIAGFTWSPGTGTKQFPTTPGAPQASLAGRNDGVVAILRTAGKGAQDLRYATLLGGKDYDVLTAILTEDSGVITAAGFSDGGFSGTNGAFDPVGSPRDALLVRVDPNGAGPRDLQYVSFLGGPAGSQEAVIDLDRGSDGRIHCAGYSDARFPTTTGALQPLPGGLLDAFVATFDPLPANAHRFGASSGGCRGSQWLQVDSNPRPGNPAFQVLANGAPIAAPGALVIDIALLNPPVKLWNVDLLVAPTLVWPATSDSNGAWRTPQIALPPSWPPPPSVYMQTIWLGPSTCSNGPFSASHALGI